ncbi:MAG: Fe-S protein assembly co-chaperone HscB [Anaeromyxobacter sp.]|nr:Fe-S protein assembly co-chaperone HscB [Anaeromyxobacter sp.]MBL0276626.1 Fe-S protein assembly co-chaperone HscB [Anaeromyxobacter sp.]
MSCWSCNGPTVQSTSFCGSCRRIQPVGRTEDYYSLFDLPREFALDPAELERRFRERSRQLHPDRFARAEPRERRLSLERATRLNDAHRALKDWRLRAAYLLKLAGQDVFGEGRTFHDPAFLEEQLEWREALGLARADGDAAALADIAARARHSLAALESEVATFFREPEWFSETVLEISRRLSRARYYDNIVSDAERG